MKKLSLIFLFLLFVASFLIPESLATTQTDQTLIDPSWQHPLGTDSLGRDYLSRILVGARVSMWVGLGSSLISFLIGIILSSWLARSPRWDRLLASRFVDILQGLPSWLVIAILMQVSDENSLWKLTILMGLFHWPSLVRITQSEMLKIQAEPYVEASQALGATRFYTLRKHIWPACYSVWMTWFCFHLPAEIMFESSLSFLGFGVQPPQASLGVLIWEGWQYLSLKPIFIFAPSGLIFFLVLSLYKLKPGFVKSNPG